MTDPLAKWLDELEAKAKAATPGERELWTGCSWRRIGIKYQQSERPIIEPIVARHDGHPDLSIRNMADVELLCALDPATVTALVRVVRAVDTFERSAGENHAVAGQAWSDTCDALNALRALVAGKLA